MCEVHGVGAWAACMVLEQEDRCGHGVLCDPNPTNCRTLTGGQRRLQAKAHMTPISHRGERLMGVPVAPKTTKESPARSRIFCRRELDARQKIHSPEHREGILFNCDSHAVSRELRQKAHGSVHGEEFLMMGGGQRQPLYVFDLQRAIGPELGEPQSIWKSETGGKLGDVPLLTSGLETL